MDTLKSRRHTYNMKEREYPRRTRKVSEPVINLNDRTESTGSPPRAFLSSSVRWEREVWGEAARKPLSDNAREFLEILKSPRNHRLGNQQLQLRRMLSDSSGNLSSSSRTASSSDRRLLRSSSLF